MRYGVRIRIAGFEQVTRRHEQMAETLGAGPWRVFTTVTIPLSAKTILAEKSPDEADSYAQHVLGVVDAVADAKGGVSAEETAAIERIKETLGA